MNTAELQVSNAATGAPVRHAQATLRLPPRATRRLRGLAGARVGVLMGRIWLTETGVDADRFIAAGASCLIEHGGTVVIECDSAEAALVTVQPAGPAWVARLRARLLGAD